MNLQNDDTETAPEGTSEFFANDTVKSRTASTDDAANELETAFLPLWQSLVANRTAIDVGAHIGTFSAALLDVGFETWAIEPNPRMYSRLIESFGGHPKFHALNVAASSDRRIDRLMFVNYKGSQTDDQIIADGLYSSLEPHPTFEGFAFSGSQAVVVWPLKKLASANLLPSKVGLLKIDTEGHDAAVIEGMGALRPEIILVEYWNHDFTFNRGKTRNDIDTYRALLGSSGYNWNIVFSRQPGTNQEDLLINAQETPKGTWGNIAFFCSDRLSNASLDWYRRL
jgi:FkbM family methyltransferase